MTDDEIERAARAVSLEVKGEEDCWRAYIDHAKAAIAAIRQPDPPADTVRVRVAVAVAPDGTEAWTGNNMAEALAGTPPGTVGHWLTADLPIPVVREVVARVEPT
jgi:hypothetical protein